MFRRKSRSVHNTAYTGVNHSAPAANQPNNNALAAALTIGHSLKNGDGGSYNGIGGGSRSGSIQRSTSFQSVRRPVAPKANSLLKRSPSMTPSVSGGGISHRKNGEHFRNFSSASDANSDVSRTYDIDDSMNDSYLDEITEETNRHYNQETVKDLKLSQPNVRSRASMASPKRHSMMGQGGGNVGPNGIKMVKKYIPTPNGIKVIEVPEENLQREINRNNSIRSGANIPRTGSINSFTGVTRTARRQPSSRMSSLVKSPQLGQMREEAEQAPLKEVSPLRESSPSQLEYEQLEKKIAEEKEMQRKLEEKRKEYEELKRKRLQHEAAFVNGEAPAEKTEDKADTTNGTVVHTVTGLGLQDETTVQKTTGSPAITAPVLGQVDSSHDNDFISPVSSHDRYTESDYSVEVAQDADRESVETLDEDKEVSEVIPETAIDPKSVVVDELDKAKAPAEEVSEEGDSEEEVSEAIPEASIDPGAVVVDELEKPGPIPDASYATIKPEDGKDEDFGIEEGELDENDTPVVTKGPKFDTVLDIIEDPVDSENEFLKPQPVTNGGSSISSGGSDESPSRKKPIKSAMKNSSSFYTPTQANPKANAAHSAYLSLTTAENTRLNSKMSAGQLNDASPMFAAPSHHYPSPSPTTPNGKRMSTTMRKQPHQTPSPLTVKSLRPQSMQMDGTSPPPGGPKSKMSARSLRDRSSVHVQPIAPHPALQPNYQSSSKARANQLYERASMRPHSTFNLERKSSFSNEHGANEPKMRFSMRDMVQPVEHPQTQARPPQPQTQAQKPSQRPQRQSRLDPGYQTQQVQGPQFTKPPSRVPNTGNEPTTPQKQSRIVDSDDEVVNSPDSGVFSSRHNDSDEERDEYLPYSHPNSQYRQFRESKQMTTLRDPPQAAKPPKEQKEKRKFSGRLKKIFGRS